MAKFMKKRLPPWGFPDDTMSENPHKFPDPLIDDMDLYQSFQLMKQRDFDAADELIEKGIEKAKNKKDETLQGLYLSARGVLYKMKKDYKESYKYYQQAEKLLKDDHSIRIITAVLLIEEFKQYETAVKKLQKTIQVSTDPVILHHARAIQAIGYFMMGKKDLAKQNFEYILAQNFDQLRFAANLDFKMIELFVAKKFELKLCEDYLKKALALAQDKKEQVFEAVIVKLLSGLRALSKE